ncbi:hypothetical protein Cgig2_012838 [Carnegiea gigantea]|uniref:Protein FAR1-RELATED SEQUENCE n=1 Tax=Carnegiea gigantea TaxID=171969 RepID=A0A9Q1QE39_9CARY|nr:hypothetical protein Cgig2_012838 [Carnegiea gigantea]
MFDLNELPNNEVTMGLLEQDMLDSSRDMIESKDMSALDYGLNNSNQIEISDGSSGTHPQVEPNFKPFVGQTFLSEEEALLFYQKFARLHGFNIRKDHIDKKDEKVVRDDFFCHRGRTQPYKEIDPTKGQRNRVSHRSNYDAHMRINCEGLTIRQIIRMLELEKNVVHGELPSVEKDIRNLFTKVMKQLVGNDVILSNRWMLLSNKIKQRNLHNDMLAIEKINVLKVKSPLEKQASEVLTSFAFEKFKEECSRSIQYLILYVSGNNFSSRYYKGSHNRNHQIFLHKDSHKIPSAYLPSRWCLQHHGHELDVLKA